MKWYYSASMKGFYNDVSHPTLPDDVVEITDEHRLELLHKQAHEGCEICPDVDGRPKAVDRSAMIRAKDIDSRYSAKEKEIMAEAVNRLIASNADLQAKLSVLKSHADNLRAGNGDVDEDWPA